MQFKTLITRPSLIPPLQYSQRPLSIFPRFHVPLFPSNLSLTSTPKNRLNRTITTCISPAQELIDNDPGISGGNDEGTVTFSEQMLEAEGEGSESEERQTIWNQMKEIVKFSGPATGLWICGPLMSLIDTAVIGQGSSIELAALGIIYSWNMHRTNQKISTSSLERKRNLAHPYIH